MTHALSTLTPFTESGGTNALIDEIERYLEAVALFRALGHEPTWARESGSEGPVVALIAPFTERAHST